MATCDVPTLFADSKCFFTATPGQWDVLQLALLCRIYQALVPMASCNVQTLMDDAACFYALKGGEWRVLMLQLLCEINTNIVNALPLCGHGSPEGVVTGTICGQSYLDLDTNTSYSFAGTVGTNTGWV